MGSVDLVFNDPSFVQNLSAGALGPREMITGFVTTLAELVTSAGVSATLRASIWFDELRFITAEGEHYGFSDWRGDRLVDRDARVFFGQIGSKVPAESGFEPEQEDALVSYGYEIVGREGTQAWAAAVALVGGHVLASLSTGALWDTSVLRLERQEGGDALIDDSRKVFEIAHASNIGHVPQVAAMLRKRARDSIVSDAQLGSWCDVAFPNLRFSPDALEKDGKLDARRSRAAVEKLARMDETARVWQETGDCVYLFDWSPESEATRANKELLEARRFRLPDGGSALFESHTRISERHRIHFIEDRNERTFVIGYIGDHLPTVRYPH